MATLTSNTRKTIVKNNSNIVWEPSGQKNQSNLKKKELDDQLVAGHIKLKFD